MASIGTGTMTIEFSPQARRQLDRLTKAIESLAKSQKGDIVFNNHIEDTVDREVYRDAVTGEYVTRAYAEAHPDTTVKETEKSRVIPHE